MRNPHPLEYLFHPRSIAVVGVSSNPDSLANRMFLQSLIDFQFPGPIYPINPHADYICGLKAYKSLRDVPIPLDYVIISIHAPFTLQVMADCATQRVKAVSLYTAGFGESGQDSGRELGNKLLAIARSAGIRVIGPNCVGIYCPASKLTFNSMLPRDSGNLAFVSQSGRYAQEFASLGARRGLRFSKVISYGNASDLNESDFIDYLSHDLETKVIAAYLEGAREGHRLFNALTTAGRKKPVLILKGGSTGPGARTAFTHTSSVAGSDVIWQALVKQTSALSVDNIEDLVDLSLSFSLIQPPRNRGVAIVGGGGGASVLAADACLRAGLTIPELSPELQQRLRQVMPEVGTSVRNPVDYSPRVFHEPQLFADTIRLVASSPEIHTIIPHIILEFTPRAGAEVWEAVIDATVAAGKACGKPMMLVTGSADTPQALATLAHIRQKCTQAGFPVYTTMAQAIRALAQVVNYYCR